MTNRSGTYLTPIDFGSLHYNLAVQLRYTLFYQKHGIPFDSIWSRDESQDAHLALICKKNDTVLAYGCLAKNNPQEFQIHQMVVMPEFQGLGYGSQILEALIQLAQAGKASKIVLNARVDKARFYEKAGFTKVGDIFASAATGVPHIKMKKLVHPSIANSHLRV